ncbi:MAG TPA: prepilin peptidase [Acidimicrobiia bacterium]|nr:prepilin peptidase [Acidimicrobiia bacterium]
MNIDALSSSQWLVVWLITSGLFGLAIGSFLNVIIWRIPNNLSILQPASHCPGCKEPISRFDNIPVVSYMLLLGKCRNCAQRISPRYPLIEILCASVWVITTWRLGLHVHTIGYALFFSGLIALGAIDIDTKLLPKKIVYPSGALLVGVLALSSVGSGEYNRLRDAAIVGCAYSAFLGAVWFASGGRAMGFGDVRLAVWLGFAMGYYGYMVSYFGLLLSFFLGSVIGIAIAGISHGGRKMKIPFGPFLAAGTVIAIWLAPQVHDFVSRTLNV